MFCEPIVSNSASGFETTIPPFFQRQYFLKLCQITLVLNREAPLRSCTPSRNRTSLLQHYAKCPTIRRRGYRREMILLALLTSRKSNSCTQPTRRFICPPARNPTTQLAALRPANLQVYALILTQKGKLVHP